MKVIHIIPAAFDYFQDIENRAFVLIQKESEYGVGSEAFTIHYGSVTKKQKLSVKESAPSTRFLGTFDAESLFAELANFDLVHLHSPFFGIAKHLIRWKMNNSKPLIVTYHRDFEISDSFSFFVWGYLRYYLPRIFQISDAVACQSMEFFKKSAAGRFLKDPGKLLDLAESARQIESGAHIHLTDDADKIKLIHADVQALAYIKLYKSLI